MHVRVNHIDAPQHGVSHQVTHETLTGAADLLAADDNRQRHGRLANEGVAQTVHFRAVGVYQGLDGRIFGDGGAHVDRIAGPGARHAVAVKSHVEMTEVAAPLESMHHQNGVAVGARGYRRIRASRNVAVDRRGVRRVEEGVAVTADDDVHTVHGLRQRDVFNVADVRQRHNLVDALGRELIHSRLHGRHFVCKMDVGAGAGENRCFLRGHTHDANLLAVDRDNGGGCNESSQERLCAGVNVGADHGEVDAGNQAGQLTGAIVELVIADGHRIVTKHIHGLGDDIGFEQTIEQRTLELVASIYQHHIVVGGAELVDRGGQTGRAADSVLPVHARVGVIGVQ